MNGRIHNNDEGRGQHPELTGQRLNVKNKFIANSRFSARESAAVSEWLSSDLPFHIMRDHNYHNSRILAGMWGAKLGNGTRERYGDMVRIMLQEVVFSYVYFYSNKSECIRLQEKNRSMD